VQFIKILVVDDSEVVRQSIRQALQQIGEFQDVAEAADGLEAVRQARELQPDVILLDIGLPGINGIEASRRIRKVSPTSKIIFLSQESDIEVVKETLRLGAQGYLVKFCAAGELFPAIDAVLQGRQFISSGVEPFLNTEEVKQTITWRVSGTYFEVCNCEAICPCRKQGGMKLFTGSTYGYCDFALSWRIVNGRFAGIDLSDRFVVMAGSYSDDEPNKPWRVILYVDNRSSDGQFAALRDIFLGRAGGTALQNFAGRIGATYAVRRAAIELDHRPRRWFMRASTWVEVRASRTVSSRLPVTCGIPGHDRAGNELIADSFRVHDAPLEFELRERCGFETDFVYSSAQA
jgi:CheY-like chemotaxis protein